jgi:hypothetical protein
MSWWALPLTIWSVFTAGSFTLEAPDARIAQRLTWAQVDLERDLGCSTAATCDDVAIKLLALTSFGQLRTVRAHLAPMQSRSPLWVLAHYNYWLASADHAFLREHWPALATSLFAPPVDRVLADRGLDLAASEAIVAMARALNDTATVTRVQATLAASDRQAQEAGGIFGVALGVLNADRAEAIVSTIADTIHTQIPLATGIVALALYKQHQEPDAFRMLQHMAVQRQSTSAMYVLPLMKGLLGWEVDAPNRAIGLEPHLPDTWRGLNAIGLVAGRDTISALLRREGGLYTIQLRRNRSAPALAVQLSPALARGARLRHVKINDRDAALQIDATPYDTHVLVEFEMRGEAVVEIEYDFPAPRKLPR